MARDHGRDEAGTEAGHLRHGLLFQTEAQECGEIGVSDDERAEAVRLVDAVIQQINALGGGTVQRNLLGVRGTLAALRAVLAGPETEKPRA